MLEIQEARERVLRMKAGDTHYVNHLGWTEIDKLRATQQEMAEECNRSERL